MISLTILEKEILMQLLKQQKERILNTRIRLTKREREAAIQLCELLERIELKISLDK